MSLDVVEVVKNNTFGPSQLKNGVRRRKDPHDGSGCALQAGLAPERGLQTHHLPPDPRQTADERAHFVRRLRGHSGAGVLVLLQA